ncbi:MAG: hypothetical protein K0V04_44145 [Deltaproteobacteria bacterium]|nr:hypothetical protein [Deltaproteobacteria bacterium]
MPCTLGLLLSQHNARARRPPDSRVEVVLLERTLLDPPRAAATKRWGEQLRRSFPKAKLVPYAWHLLSHGPDERMQQRTTRTLSGEPHGFGDLQDNPQTRQAWDVTRLCLEALGSSTLAVRTPPSLTPGSLGRTRIRAFVEARKAAGIDVIWEPQGLWEAPDAILFARQIGCAVMFPAFAGGRAVRTEGGDGLAASGAWLRVDGSGPRQAIHGGHVDDLLDHLDVEPNTVTVFAGPRARNNLAQLSDALNE